MQNDILKDTWVFQHVRSEGKEEGLQKGKQEGKQEASEELLIQFVEARFPTLLSLTKQVLVPKQSAEQLRVTLNSLYRANTIEEAQEALLGDS